MRAVVQRVARARVSVAGEVIGSIGRGCCVLLGVGPDDDEEVARRLARRVRLLRIFDDDHGRMNLDLSQAGGAVLVISQFTLYADTSRGLRPSFAKAGRPDLAERLCAIVVAQLAEDGIPVATGRFGARMDVEMVNAGPVTLVLSSGEPAWSADAG